MSVSLTDWYLQAYWRTNAIQYSEDLTQDIWTKSGATISTVGLDQELTESGTTAYHYVSQVLDAANNSNVAVSWQFKSSGRTLVLISVQRKDGTFCQQYVNLDTGALGAVKNSQPFTSIAIQDMTEGWYRVKAVCNVRSGNSDAVLAAYIATSQTDNDTGIQYAGNGSSGILVDKAQFEPYQAACTDYIQETSTSKAYGVVDLAPYVLTDGIQLEWGRDYGATLYGKTTPGRLTVKLDNSDGRFSPFNAAGPYYHNMLPTRAIFFQMYIPYPPGEMVTSCSWQGPMESIQPSAAIGELQAAELIGVGCMALLANRTVSIPIQSNRRTDQILSNIITQIAWPSQYYPTTFSTGDVRMTKFWAGEQNALSVMRELEDTEAGLLLEECTHSIANPYSSSGWGLHFQNRAYRDNKYPVATFSDAAVGDQIPYSQIRQYDYLNRICNRATAEVIVYTTGIASVLWTLPEVPMLVAGESVSYWAQCTSLTASGNVAAVSTWTTPVSGTDYFANAEPDGSGTDLTSSMTVTVSKFDTSMKITVTNGAGSSAYLTLLRARGTPIYASDTVHIKADDLTSQTDYGVRDYAIPAKWLPSTEDAQTLCDHIVGLYAQPTALVELTFSANHSTEALRAALMLRISERVTVVANNEANFGLNGDFFVEHIRHDLQGKDNLWTTLLLSQTGIPLEGSASASQTPSTSVSPSSTPSASASESASASPSSEAIDAEEGCYVLYVVDGEVDTDASLSSVFYIESGSADFKLNNPTNFNVCGSPILWCIVGTGTVSVDTKFNDRGNVFDLSGGRDYIGGIYNAAFDRIDLFWNQDPNGGSRSSSASASVSRSASAS